MGSTVYFYFAETIRIKFILCSLLVFNITMVDVQNRNLIVKLQISTGQVIDVGLLGQLLAGIDHFMI